MSEMVLMCGLSGLGKTTFAKDFAKRYNYEYLGIDDFYAKYNGDECIHENTFEVWISFYQAIHEKAIQGKDIIIDTNAITRCHREQFLDWFPEFEVKTLIIIEGSEELRYKNNRSRRRVIPDAVMARMKENWEPFDKFKENRWDFVYKIENENNTFIGGI